MNNEGLYVQMWHFHVKAYIDLIVKTWTEFLGGSCFNALLFTVLPYYIIYSSKHAGRVSENTC